MKIEITEEMPVAEIFNIAPKSVIIFQNAKLDCTGCKAQTDRTLKKVFETNKVDQATREKILTHLNQLEQFDPNLLEPTAEELKAEKIQEGNKTYYKLGGMLFSDNAYKNLHQFADGKNGLRINLTTGGCSGFKYQYDYYDKPKPGERAYQLSDTFEIYMDDLTFNRSKDSVVDFPIGLHSSGLQIINPNKKHSCSCGISIGF